MNLTAENGNRILLGLAERVDLIVDFTRVPRGNHVLAKVGPDEPFGGGEPGEDFDTSDPGTTGQVMQFRVVRASSADASTPPRFLQLPAITALPPETVTRPLALLEQMSEFHDGPAEALLGTVDGDPNVAPGVWAKHMWMDAVTENPAVGTTEVWEMYNTTEDAHPMHIHALHFEVVSRQDIQIDEETQQVQVVPGSTAPANRPGALRGRGHVVAMTGDGVNDATRSGFAALTVELAPAPR